MPLPPSSASALRQRRADRLERTDCAELFRHFPHFPITFGNRPSLATRDLAADQVGGLDASRCLMDGRGARVTRTAGHRLPLRNPYLQSLDTRRATSCPLRRHARGPHRLGSRAHQHHIGRTSGSQMIAISPVPQPEPPGSILSQRERKADDSVELDVANNGSSLFTV